MGRLVALILDLYIYVLIGRVIIDYVMMFSASWRPQGLMLGIVDFIFRVTDPPLRYMRRFIPPLRLGQVSLDLSFIVLFFGIQFARFFALVFLP
jgi:YggT family protein